MYEIFVFSSFILLISLFLQLVTLGVASESIKIGTCSMESEKFITACETVNGAGQVAIVDLTAGNAVTKQRMSAEAAIMNPVSKVIALRGKNIKCLCNKIAISWTTTPNFQS